MKRIYSIIAFIVLSTFSFSNVSGQKTQRMEEVPQYDKVKETPFITVSGLETNWTVEISPVLIKFHPENIAEAFAVPYSLPKISSDGLVKTYHSFSDKHEIEISISNEKCLDRVLEMPEFVTIVKYREIGAEDFYSLKGRAIQVVDNRLNCVWRLREVKGQAVTPEDFGMELPYIDLHVRKNAFTGFAGCNPIRGDLVMTEGVGLVFSNMKVSKMSCITGNKERLVIEALSNSVTYELRGNKLYLLKNNVIQAVFVKST